MLFLHFLENTPTLVPLVKVIKKQVKMVCADMLFLTAPCTSLLLSNLAF